MPEVAPWPPTRYTPPLGPVLTSAADRFIPALQLAWRVAFGHELEAWQVELIRAILEVCPPGHPRAGHLRFRQVLVSMGRQNGKTEVAAFLALLMLLVRVAALVIGIASSAEQARLVYRRAASVVTANDALRKRFSRLTDTRGLASRSGGVYEIKAAKEAALQGLPITLGVVDEVHLIAKALWMALVAGLGGRDDCLVVGITTAGDEGSELLKHLYGLFESGDGGDSYGAFIWEAPQARVPADDEELGHYLRCANPSVASGRLSLANVIADCRSMPEPDVIRYRLNRFVAASASFLPYGAWEACREGEPAPAPATGVVFSVDRTPGWEYACVAAAWKDSDGLVHTEVVASLARPSLAALEAVCVELASRQPRAFVMDRYQLKDLATSLAVNHGLTVESATLADQTAAASTFYALAVQRRLRHPGDALMAVQLPSARRKNVGEGFRITRPSTATHVDAVIASALAVHYAETLPEVAPQFFVF